MKKYSHILLICSLLLVVSCQTIEQIPMDYLVPADVSFPPELRRVAIVNNTSTLHTNQILPDAPARTVTEITRQITYPEGDATLATESLAETIANENYFDKVVICDSALRIRDHSPREATLSREEVNQLTQELDVDFLISLENLQMKAVRIVRALPDWGVIEGVVDVKVYPTVRVYLPNRNTPMVTITTNDSIFWQELGATYSQVRARLINDKDLVREASAFAGTVPVEKLVPYWKTGSRYIYTNGTVAMRDAYVHVRAGNWEGAYPIWLHYFETTKKPKQKMRAAYNIAVYYEMKDDIEKAEEWLLKAQELAMEIEKVEKKGTNSDNRLTISEVPNYAMTVLYMQELQERKNHLSKLTMQMKRFENDF